jgi:hypothetical protein
LAPFAGAADSRPAFAQFPAASGRFIAGILAIQTVIAILSTEVRKGYRGLRHEGIDKAFCGPHGDIRSRFRGLCGAVIACVG